MSAFQYRIAELIVKFHREGLSPEEKEELHTWVGDSLERRELFRELTDSGEIRSQLEKMNAYDEKAVREKIEAQYPNAFSPGAIRSTIGQRIGFRWAAAACILVLMSAAAILYLHHKLPNGIAKNSRSNSLQNDVQPGGNKAILTLANGAKIVLDSAHNGQLATLGNTHVIKTGNGNLLYAAVDKADSSENGLNVLVTPRGGVFQVTLPDGTQAWLNAESSLTYPTRFTGRQRRVTVTGEVYFEVAKDATHPFMVSLPAKTKREGEDADWMQVQVLGTHFDIDGYADNDDGMARTTLLEGSVKISAHGRSRLIKPGEQAAASFAGQDIALSDNVDLDNIMAWKNGEMVLSHGNLQKLMQDISRWYDVDIEYQTKVPDEKFSGSISRNVPLSSVLDVLKAYGVPTRLEGKKVIVL